MAVRAVLVSTYDLGHQSFGLASPAAWLRRAGHEVRCADLSVGVFPERAVRDADGVAFYLPMHAATRMAAPVMTRVRDVNPLARLCAYGLYAPLNADYLRSLGVETILGPEFEADLVRWLEGFPPQGGLPKLSFVTPDRTGLPAADRYAKLRVLGSERVTGYTEASRGCKHLCGHCPIVPVYQGAFRVVPVDVVLADIRQQVEAGSEHITFGDPDFFNGPTHAMRIVEALHAEHPAVTYDATIKVEHLRNHRDLLPRLRSTGCLFVTTAVESLDDAVLAKLSKGHTRADFIETVADCRAVELPLSPTFIAFHPWTTLESHRDLLRTLRDMSLIDNVAPIQLALRLLLPQGSLLLNLPEIRDWVTGFDSKALVHRWRHPDPEMEALGAQSFRTVSENPSATRREIFGRLCHLAFGRHYSEPVNLLPPAAIPYLTEPWYC